MRSVLNRPDAIATPFEERLAAAAPQVRFFAAMDQSELNFARFDVYADCGSAGAAFAR